MKKYVLIAGVNGAGKSTLYQVLDSLSELPRINIDETVRSFGDWRNPVDVMKAGKLAMYDNTESFRRFAIYEDGILADISSSVPDWYKKLKI